MKLDNSRIKCYNENVIKINMKRRSSKLEGALRSIGLQIDWTADIIKTTKGDGSSKEETGYIGLIIGTNWNIEDYPHRKSLELVTEGIIDSTKVELIDYTVEVVGSIVVLKSGNYTHYFNKDA